VFVSQLRRHSRSYHQGAVLVCAGLLAGACILHTACPPGSAATAGGKSGTATSDCYQTTSGSGTVSVGLEQRHQTLVGFGASVAWHLSRVVGETPKGLYQLLFSELGLDIVRFRNRYRRSDASDRNLAQEVEVLRRATEALGRRPMVMLSSWSPPAALKASGREKCHGNPDCTLRKQRGQFVYQQFADYWYDSLRHYASLGIAPDFVSIQNEPSFLPPFWEGCKFEPAETSQYPGYDRALVAVHARLASLPDPPKLLGPEVLGLHWNRVQNYLRPLQLELLHGVAHHLYERGTDSVWDWREPGPDSFVDEMRAVARTTTLPLFQTEFHTDEDQGVDGGFETAWLIHHSLVEEGVVAFLYWDLIWEGQRGLVGMTGKSPKPRDQYYSVRHYARFTDPGDVRVGASADPDQLLASAYLSPQHDRLTLVILNPSQRQLNVRIDPGGFVAAKSAAYRTTYRPGRSQRWEALGSVAAPAATPLPARSVATVVLSRAR
jgi:glucuronoarabinoxylan endo-1,4-beta-xylanase